MITPFLCGNPHHWSPRGMAFQLFHTTQEPSLKWNVPGNLLCKQRKEVVETGLKVTHLEAFPPTYSKDRNFWKRRDLERVVWKPLSKEPTSQFHGWETCEEIVTVFLPSEALLFYHWICEHRLWVHSLRSSETAERARLREISQSFTLLSYMTPGQVF